MPDGNGHRPTPPYFAFRTLLNTLERMEEPGPPPRIDRTFLDNMSGAGQTQFIAGLKSIGLAGENGKVTEKLIELVNQRDNRKALITQLLRERYPEAVELGKTTATAGQLEETFNEVYGVRGDTARKAIAFYLKAAEYAEDIPLSPKLQDAQRQAVERDDRRHSAARKEKPGQRWRPEPSQWN